MGHRFPPLCHGVGNFLLHFVKLVKAPAATTGNDGKQQGTIVEKTRMGMLRNADPSLAIGGRDVVQFYIAINWLHLEVSIKEL